MAKKNSRKASITLAQRYPSWKQLQRHAVQLQRTTLAALFLTDKQRSKRFAIDAAGLHLDFSENLITRDTLALFEQLARDAKLKPAIRALLAGMPVNNTEQRPAWHSALRHQNPPGVVAQTLQQMSTLVEAVHSGSWRGFTKQRITDVVNIGIGGSDLGPRMATIALAAYHQPGLRVHFVSNIDPADIVETLGTLDAETTLFIIASKSFTTLETLANANKARDWFLQYGKHQDIAKHFVAVSSAIEKAQAFGIHPDNVYPLWDWVGGRYSLWSAIGLPIAFAIGMENFRQLLAGAHHMDLHFASAPMLRNMPVILGLLGLWYNQCFHAQTHVILPYSHALTFFPDFLQQLDMESVGKHVDKDGHAIDYPTGSILWGAVGTNGQHSFHQLLHQGKQFFSADFILPLTTAHDDHHLNDIQHRHLVANCLSQRQAMLFGKTLAEAKAELRAEGKTPAEIARLAPHKVVPGNRPNNIITFEALTPATLGALVALYEHKVYVQSVIWHINAFDQWGVELGKQLSKPIFDALSADPVRLTLQRDSSTTKLVQQYLAAAKKTNPG